MAPLAAVDLDSIWPYLGRNVPLLIGRLQSPDLALFPTFTPSMSSIHPPRPNRSCWRFLCSNIQLSHTITFTAVTYDRKPFDGRYGTIFSHQLCCVFSALLQSWHYKVSMETECWYLGSTSSTKFQVRCSRKTLNLNAIFFSDVARRGHDAIFVGNGRD